MTVKLNGLPTAASADGAVTMAGAWTTVRVNDLVTVPYTLAAVNVSL